MSLQLWAYCIVTVGDGVKATMVHKDATDEIVRRLLDVDDSINLAWYSPDSAVEVDHLPDGDAMFYHESLDGPQGAHFLLFREPKHTLKHLAHAKRRLRDQRDVTGITVLHIRKWCYRKD